MLTRFVVLYLGMTLSVVLVVTLFFAAVWVGMRWYSPRWGRAIENVTIISGLCVVIAGALSLEHASRVYRSLLDALPLVAAVVAAVTAHAGIITGIWEARKHTPPGPAGSGIIFS